ncbi:regulator of hemoglobinization and erythroid cell expansion protein [Sylvia atricapilla]|uniref:regulator of hemoglobinization and erythroid cell expansion protein n=1 Tax=Sylvia atricapilla TaxID=48155 RepID=UPI003396C805
MAWLVAVPVPVPGFYIRGAKAGSALPESTPRSGTRAESPAAAPGRRSGRPGVTWVPAVTSLGTLLLYSLLLLVLYVMLSRKIAQHSCGMQASSSPGEGPSPAPALSPGGDKAPKPGAQNPGTQTPAPAYAESSDTSSDTSEDSEDSGDNPSCPQEPQGRGSEENINYTSLVFPGKGHGQGSALGYENEKTGLDYVNVDPKKRKTHFWPFSSPRASKGVEYTEVKL